MSQAPASDRPALACVILAGGRSRRFGSNKALAAFHGTRLVDHLVGRLRDQTAGPIAVNASDALGDETHVSDRIEGDIGPLAGLHAALCWAGENQQDAVITTPVDTPMLPADYVARLAETGAPAVAHYNDRTHALHGIWPTALRDRLEACIQGGMRAARDWCAAIEAATCPFPATPGHDPFFNVNTPEDLARLLKDQPVSPR